VFGGTFDPPHIGHLILAGEARYQLGLDRVVWVLTPQPPHKRGLPISSTAIRLALLQAAIAGEPAFELSRVDIDRPPPHYAVDTLRLLRRQYPQAALIYLMGGDSLHDLPTWHDPAGFVQVCAALGVMRRPGDQVDLDNLAGGLPGLSEKLQMIDAPLIEIASREIRERAALGRPFRYYLPDAVYRLVMAQGLYLPALPYPEMD
jgi:nicotinate-nucleotide adenylyltransferase